MKKLLGIALAGLLVFGVSGTASAAFDYGNLHFVGIEDSDPSTKHDTGDGTYEYHADLGDFSVLPSGMGPGEDAGMVGPPITVDTGMTLDDFDATSWDDIYFGGYGLDALWYPPNDPSRVEYPGAAGAGIVFLSAHEVTADNLGSASGSALIGLIDGTKDLAAGQVEMSDTSASYLKFNSDPEVGNYNNAVNIDDEFWNAELAGLGNMFLYGFDKNDKTTLTKLTEFELKLDPTDGSLVVSEVPVPASVLLLGSGLLGLFGIRRKKS